MMFLGNFAKIPLFSLKLLIKLFEYSKNCCTFASSDSNNAHTYGSDKLNNLIFITMNTTMTYRLYKDEYNSELLYQLENDLIEGLMATDESTEKVLVISGTLEDLQKLASLMYENDAQKIKSVFPTFVTQEDQERMQKDLFMQAFNELRDNLCKMIDVSKRTHNKDTKEFDLMYDMCVQMMQLSRA